jgi:two-component system, NarL family, sensor kinase
LRPLAWLRRRGGGRVREGRKSRERLVAQALYAEDRERRRLAQQLHDEAVQNLLASHMALRRVRSGDLESLDIVEEAIKRTTRLLRETILQLHPPAIEHDSLDVAIARMAEGQARLGNLRVDLDIDPDIAGSHDLLLFSLSRELLSNALRHSHGTHVSLGARRTPDYVVLEVRDNGKGIQARARAQAVSRGHIGLATSSERVSALGGTFEIESAPGHGTRVRVALPARRSSDRVARTKAPGYTIDRRSHSIT